jgi:hypothetical protein
MGLNYSIFDLKRRIHVDLGTNMRWRWFFEIYAESGCRLTKDDYEYLYRGIIK